MILRMVVQMALMLLFMGAVLILAAGTADWPAAWAFLGELGVLGVAVGLWLAWRDPALLAERLRSPLQPDQPPWDRRFIIGGALGFTAWLALMGLDAQRLRLSAVPSFLQGVGVLLILAAVWIGWLTFIANPWATAVVKVQPGQGVADTGPYRFVRHPLYAGAMAFFLGAPLVLGSWLGLAAAPLLIAAIGARAVREERLLREAAPGYEDYAARVRYRLVPKVW
ncbi:MAG: isoprenylcysteine carboxylmethyltransferase family protein [Caulobacteraceae bacterium]|nr:isoprenylcysteine carboxylmethyltransferase family protein [Caulobacteraceae bacterium]